MFVQDWFLLLGVSERLHLTAQHGPGRNLRLIAAGTTLHTTQPANSSPGVMAPATIVTNDVGAPKAANQKSGAKDQ